MRAQFVTQASGVRFGSKGDIEVNLGNVRFTPKADIDRACRDVRFVPKADITQRSKMTYSITSSAVESSLSEMTRPSAVAVFRLITSSYLFGA